MSLRALSLFAALALVACAGAPSTSTSGGDPTSNDVPIVLLPDGAVAPPLVPVQGPLRVVYAPPSGRYVNEPTLIRADDGTWHLFSNGADGVGDPWIEKQILHATAPSLAGPWTEQPDVLATSDPGATEGVMHAPFVMRDAGGFALLYFDSTQAIDHGLHVARSTDLFHWTRDPAILPGGRDPMVLRGDDGVDRLFTTATTTSGDGIHDVVLLNVGRALSAWSSSSFAVENPSACPSACWGWYESPFVDRVDEHFYLFTTFTSSAQDGSDYRRTYVFRSTDPSRFEPTPITTLVAHGGEVHTEDGVDYLTSGGWPSRIGAELRGLSISTLEWKPAP